VLEEVLKQLTEGMTVTVVFAGKGTNSPSRRDPAAALSIWQRRQRRRSDSCESDVSPEQGGYALGDRVIITAVLQQKDNILWLPPQAIRTVGGRTFIAVQEADGQKRIEIAPGLQTHDRVEITGNVSEGQVVVGP